MIHNLYLYKLMDEYSRILYLSKNAIIHFVTSTGDDAEGAGGGKGQSHTDGENYEMVVRLYCKLEREVEQGAVHYSLLYSVTLEI